MEHFLFCLLTCRDVARSLYEQREKTTLKTSCIFPSWDSIVIASYSYEGADMIISNVETIPGKRVIEHYGLVSGSTVRAKHVGRDFMAGLKNIVGGELKGYTELLNEARGEAMSRMTTQAKELGANAIVNVRFATSSVAQGASELYTYGTAVKVE
jgi:uncharacterized protein YbjQ (UPF0145 family)